MKRTNDKKAVNRISSRYFKANKTLNAFAVIAVILTTLLLTCVFSLGISYAENLKTSEIRMRGSVSQLQLTDPTDEQIEKLRTLTYLKSVGTEISIDRIAISEKTSVLIKSIDSEQWNAHIKPCISDVNGKLPEAENEVMLSSHALSLLKIENPKIGMTVKLSLSDSVKEFILSGWYTEYTSDENGAALLSEKYCDKNNLSAEQGGTAFMTVKKDEKNATDRLYSDIRRNEAQIIYGDTGSGYSAPPVMLILTIVLLIVLIILSGYLLTANVLHLSVTHGIRFYGLLKVLGTGEKQIKRIVRRQALLLAGAGIPAGLVLGFALCFKVIPFALGSLDGESVFPKTVSFNPLIFIGAAVFALLTVIISCLRPAKTAAKVSPIEALRHTDGGNTEKKTVKHSSGNRIFRMAWRNVFRDKKRASLVFASLSLGIVLFLSITSLMNAVSGEAMAKAEDPYDFECYVRNSAAIKAYDAVTGEELEHIASPGELKPEQILEIIKRIENLNGIEKIDTVKSADVTFPFDEKALEPILRAEYARQLKIQENNNASMALNPGEIPLSENASYDDFIKIIKKQSPLKSSVFSLSEEYVKEYNLTAVSPADIKSFNNGETCLVDAFGESAAEMIGKYITLTSKATGEKVTLKIDGVFTKTTPIISRAGEQKNGYIEGIYISDALMEKLSPDAPVERISIKVKPESEPLIKNELTSIENKIGEGFSFSAKSDIREEKENLIRTTKILGGGLSLLLLLTGILNFINVMFTGILTRKREFTIMQSIGMSGKQLFRLLLWEGIIYVLFTLLISLTLSGAIYLIMAKTIPSVFTFAAFSFPFIPAIVTAVLITLICIATAAIMYKYSVRDSVTERLHDVFASE